MRLPAFVCLALFCFTVTISHAQNRPGGVVDTNIANVSNLPAQKIAPNDLIGISVYDAPELTRTMRVDADGTISLKGTVGEQYVV